LAYTRLVADAQVVLAKTDRQLTRPARELLRQRQRRLPRWQDGRNERPSALRSESYSGLSLALGGRA
jgi:hypothetical protein